MEDGMSGEPRNNFPTVSNTERYIGNVRIVRWGRYGFIFSCEGGHALHLGYLYYESSWRGDEKIPFPIAWRLWKAARREAESVQEAAERKSTHSK